MPAAQRVQLAAPALAEYEPGKQPVHTLALELPGTGFAVPAAQLTQALLLDEPVFGL